MQRKWVAATRTLLAALAADQPAAEAMAAVDVMAVGTTGMPLLQLAVRSQRLDLVQEVLGWGEAHGERGRGCCRGGALQTAGCGSHCKQPGCMMKPPATRPYEPFALNTHTRAPVPPALQATCSAPPRPAAAA